MTHIAIHADALSTFTSSMPNREMLVHLTRIRSADRFTFVFFRGGNETAWWKSFRSRLGVQFSWSEMVLPRSRKFSNVLTLLGARFQPALNLKADLFLRLDAGTMGRRSLPLVQLVTDLSSIRMPRSCSLKWHGRAIYRQHLNDGARLATRTVCISKATASDVALELEEIVGTLTVIPYGIADEWFGAGPQTDCAFPERPYFIWYGQITPRKNLARLLKGYALALARCGARNDFPDLVIISNASAMLRSSIDALDLRDRVYPYESKPLTDLIGFVSRSSGLAFPSLYEGFGMPIIEAFARGVPVLTSNRSAMPEVAGGLAVLCDPERTDSIARGFLALGDPEQMTPERIAARRSHAAQFTSLECARKFSALIDQVLASHAAAAA